MKNYCSMQGKYKLLEILCTWVSYGVYLFKSSCSCMYRYLGINSVGMLGTMEHYSIINGWSFGGRAWVGEVVGCGGGGGGGCGPSQP